MFGFRVSVHAYARARVFACECYISHVQSCAPLLLTNVIAGVKDSGCTQVIGGQIVLETFMKRDQCLGIGKEAVSGYVVDFQ